MQIKECTNPLPAQNARETSTRKNANKKQASDNTDNSLMNQNNLQNNQFESNCSFNLRVYVYKQPGLDL